jgi:acyl-CoA synthetase (AMP-forming)/AMP-acid ligase II
MALPTTSIDGLVLAFGLLLTVIAGLIFGLAPSLHLAGMSDSAALVIKGASGVFSGTASAHRLSRVMVTAEVALSIALLVGMGLVLKALWNLSHVPLGFETERVLLLEVGKIPYVDSMAHIENRAVFWPQFLEKIETMPNVQAAAFTDDGYLRTGDRGELAADGQLRITGRVKEQFKTSKGKYVAPAPIENLLNASGLVEQSCVMGAGLDHVIVATVGGGNGGAGHRGRSLSCGRILFRKMPHDIQGSGDFRYLKS